MEHESETAAASQDPIMVTIKMEPFAHLETEIKKEHVGMDSSNVDNNPNDLKAKQDPTMNVMNLEPLDFLKTEIKEESDENFEYLSSHQNLAQSGTENFTHKRFKKELDYKSDNCREEIDPLALSDAEFKGKYLCNSENGSSKHINFHDSAHSVNVKHYNKEEKANIRITSFCEETIPSCSYEQKSAAGKNECEQPITISRGRNKNKKHNLEENCLNIHSGSKKRNRNIMCDICKKQFNRLFRVKDHINAVHNKIKKHACDKCGKSFSQSSNLMTHVKTVHLKIRKLEINEPFVCKTCSKVYSTTGSLKTHISTYHNGIKSFACKSCNKSFGRLAHLNSHFNTVHKMIKDYICDLCGKAFSQKTHLTDHVNGIHKKLKIFACKLCEKSYSIKSCLENHVKVVHIGIKYECEKCLKKYTGLDKLKRHISSAHTKTTL